jgi:hypothetical protein
MAEIYITSQTLLKTLQEINPNFTDQDLIDLEKFIDADPEDEWELTEGKDYRIAVKATGLREYTASGAYTIARCLDAKKQPGFWAKVREMVFHTKAKVRKAFIGKKILDNCSSLVRRSDRYWISRADLITIFGTNAQTLAKMLEKSKETQFPLLLRTDYEEFTDNGGIYFSLDGVFKISQVFGQNLTQKNRREWCGEVGEVIKPKIDNIVDQISDREKNIAKAMDTTKKRDKNTCQVTFLKRNKFNKLKLTAHHLYAQNAYPHIADSVDNLITLDCKVHDQFHVDYMGSTKKPCTVEDFIRFVHTYYPENTQIVTWLTQQQIKLGNPQPIDLSKPPHVLYLPASRVLKTA